MTGNETNYQDPGFLIVPNVSKIIFSPDGRYLAFSGTVVYLWEIGVEQRAWQLRRLAWNVNDIAFSPDGEYLAIGGVEPTIELWDVRRRRVIWEVEESIGIVRKMAFLSKIFLRHYLVSLEQAVEDAYILRLRIWEMKSGEEIWRSVFISQSGPDELLLEIPELIVDKGVLCVKNRNGIDRVEIPFILFGTQIEAKMMFPGLNLITARMWNGRRMWHPWDWADPDGALPEQNAEVRKIAEERYMLYLKSKGMAK
jgi:hypothetical protein